MALFDWDAGTTTVTTAGARVQISATVRRVKAISFENHPGNGGNVAVGRDDVSLTDGWVLIPGQELTVSFGEEQFVYLSDFYVDSATSGERVDWFVVYLA